MSPPKKPPLFGSNSAFNIIRSTAKDGLSDESDDNEVMMTLDDDDLDITDGGGYESSDDEEMGRISRGVANASIDQSRASKASSVGSRVTTTLPFLYDLDEERSGRSSTVNLPTPKAKIIRRPDRIIVDEVEESTSSLGKSKRSGVSDKSTVEVSPGEHDEIIKAKENLLAKRLKSTQGNGGQDIQY